MIRSKEEVNEQPFRSFLMMFANIDIYIFPTGPYHCGLKTLLTVETPCTEEKLMSLTNNGGQPLSKQQILVGLLPVKEEAGDDLHDFENTVERALAEVPCEDLCARKGALQALQKDRW